MSITIDGLPKLNPERKAQWVAALRSGEYVQGNEWLQRDGRMCCLGVACDLHSKTQSDLKWSNSPISNASTYAGQSAYPPEEVMSWLGIDLADLRTQDTAQRDLQSKLDIPIMHSGLVHHIFAQLNDGKNWSFDQIADFIETNF